ncbi:hypothetical protein KG091_00275 [Carnobacteriaceae bacterium zg-ZUI78]|nr:hypothetical protein [Carnobacteriaceae bacterium zg-ZUI78]
MGRNEAAMYFDRNTPAERVPILEKAVGAKRRTLSKETTERSYNDWHNRQSIVSQYTIYICKVEKKGSR